MDELEAVLTEFGDRILISDDMCGAAPVAYIAMSKIEDSSLQNKEIAKMMRNLFDSNQEAKVLSVDFSPSFARDGCKVSLMGGTITIRYTF